MIIWENQFMGNNRSFSNCNKKKSVSDIKSLRIFDTFIQTFARFEKTEIEF